MKGYSYTLNTDGFMQAKAEPSMCACVNKHTLEKQECLWIFSMIFKKSFPYLMEKVN